MEGLCISQHVHKAVISKDFELIAKLLRHETIEHLFSVYVRLKYLNLNLYLDYIVRLGRERIKKMETQRALAQALPYDISIEICNYI